MIRWVEKNRYVAIALTILLAIEIFYFSSIPGGVSTGAGGLPLVPIIYHLSVFFLFGFFLLVSIVGNKKIKISHLLIAITVSVIYAFLDEFHQMFVPFRAPTIQDILTDTAGIFLSTIFILYFKKNTNQ